MDNINTKEMPIKTKNIWFNKNFLLIWLGSSFSNLTFTLFTFSLPILIYNMTNSSIAMSTMRAIEVIPNLLFGIIIGVLVDRFSKKKILMLATLLQLTSI